MKKFINIMMIVVFASFWTTVAKKSKKVVTEYIENNSKGLAKSAARQVKKIHKCTWCVNGKVFSYGYWYNCRNCGGKGWYYKWK